jgi:plastocyanin
VIAPESETVASLRDELKARQTRQVAIREVAPSRVRVRPGETVRFYTEYSLTLPASDKEALVKATWVLLRNGRKIGREGIDNRYARAGLNTQVTELTLPPSAASGQYTVEHRVQVGDSVDVAHSRFVLAR